jgi:hypothetical protein
MPRCRYPELWLTLRVYSIGSAAMYDLCNLLEDPNPSLRSPTWVKLSLGGPFLVFMISVIALQAAETVPPLAGPAHALFLVASAGVALGFGAVFVACLVQLVRKRS